MVPRPAGVLAQAHPSSQVPQAPYRPRPQTRTPHTAHTLGGSGAPWSCCALGGLAWHGPARAPLLEGRPYLLWDSTLALGNLWLNGLLLLHGLLLELQQLLDVHGLGHDGLSCKRRRPVSWLGSGGHSRWSARTDSSLQETVTRHSQPQTCSGIPRFPGDLYGEMRGFRTLVFSYTEDKADTERSEETVLRHKT